MKYTPRPAIFVLVSILAAGLTYGDEREFDAKRLMFGNLHAHSNLSDDVSAGAAAMTPQTGFEHARSNGLDFLAITDHHKAADSSHRLSLSSEEYTTKLFGPAMALNSQRTGFVAIPGVEWGNTATGNHVNVFGAESLPPDSIKDKGYDDLFQWALTNARFVQFNHPYSWAGKSNRNRNVGNFGEALYGTVGAYRDAVDPVVKTMSVICSVRGGHISGEHKHSENKTHRDVHSKALRHYKKFLNKGFHIAPAANQDTHWSNFGTVTAARTAVWADSADYNGLMAGFKAGRVYATEDDELAVVYQVRHNDKTFWMGETVPLGTAEAEVDLLVRVWQVAGSESDPRNEGPYTVSIFSDWDGVGGRETSLWDRYTGLESDKTHSIPLMVVAGEYIYLEITEENGTDNVIGEGEDEFNAAGEHGSDGKRDNLNDDAITAPIWFVETSAEASAAAPPGRFVWTVNPRSKVYHHADCWAAKKIGSANRATDDSPPAGRTKHNCSPGR